MADYTQLMNLEKQKKAHLSPTQTQQATPQSSNQSTDQSIKQSIDPSTNQLTHLTTRSNENRIMDKPRGFYISERLNQRLDEAVRYYQEKHNLKKVDRSVIVTALLDNEAHWTTEALELLVDRVISQLTSRLTNR